jgi:hypothetical protein
LRGDGCYCVKAKGIIPGESVYVRAKVKGNGVLGYDWQIGSKRLWYTNRMNLSPASGSLDVKGWKDLFVRLRAPDDVNDLNLVLSAGPGEGSVLFDDICVYVKSRK